MVRSLQSFLLLRCFRYLFWIFRPLCTCWKVSNIENKSLYLDACTSLNSIELISSMYGCSDNFTILLQQYLFNLISQLMLFCHCLWIIFHGVYSIKFSMNIKIIFEMLHTKQKSKWRKIQCPQNVSRFILNSIL